jgi:hypothetical protein
MKPNRVSLLKLATLLCGILVLSSCASQYASTIANIPLFKVSVKAIDEADAPVAGAIVESSNGQKVTTNADGIAELKFGTLGAHMVTVMAQNRAPANFSVTMPMDMGKTMPARLGKPVEISANIKSNININVGGNMSGMFMTALYPMIFQSMFTAYGYDLEMVPYKSGEWTEWNYDTSGKNDMVMRKAFLTKLDNKQEWWQVVMDGKNKDNKMTLEVLFSAGRQSIRRMRQQTGEGQASEVPVTEGWYSAPMQLTPESMEGSVVKKGVDIQVPAGKFKADILEFSYMGSGGKLRMWRSKEVPGGLLRVELSQGNKKSEWVTELKAFGNGAKSALGSF